MLVLTIRTDKPEAELGLYDGDTELAYEIWHAHRELAESLHRKIATLLEAQGKGWPDIQAVVAFQGPGSFTGLRIGLTVANAMAYAQSVPVVATQGDDWIADGIAALREGRNDRIVVPEYGGEANITLPRK